MQKRVRVTKNKRIIKKEPDKFGNDYFHVLEFVDNAGLKYVYFGIARITSWAKEGDEINLTWEEEVTKKRNGETYKQIKYPS